MIAPIARIVLYLAAYAAMCVAFPTGHPVIGCVAFAVDMIVFDNQFFAPRRRRARARAREAPPTVVTPAVVVEPSPSPVVAYLRGELDIEGFESALDVEYGLVPDRRPPRRATALGTHSMRAYLPAETGKPHRYLEHGQWRSRTAAH